MMTMDPGNGHAFSSSSFVSISSAGPDGRPQVYQVSPFNLIPLRSDH